jgi:hypothetical protein
MYNHGARKEGTDTWLTPYWVIEQLPQILGADYYDPCPGPFPEHTRANHYCEPCENGLAVRWSEYNFVNPPYSNMDAWVEKAATEARNGNVSILFCKLDYRTKWGIKLCEKAAYLYPVKGYTRFLQPTYKDEVFTGLEEAASATFQMCFAIFGPTHQTPVIAQRLCKHLGEHLVSVGHNKP